MGTSHLIMGTATDYITGQTVPDTHDERILQAISRFLVEEKHFAKNEISTREKLVLTVDGKTGTVTVNFVIRISDRAFALVMYGPGSIVTRQRPALAAARLISPQVIPVSVITNGDDALVMDSVSGQVIGKGMESLPSRDEAILKLNNFQPVSISADRNI
ncbi:MAG: type I restriction enzyme HsdR N-terminal domain-containing protein, partial [Desulfobacteraceae bacterium]|nr:type I restriction enzyme HsdR N-terminal domain-containing protein [Desulfobacteraceae bacterium]